MEIVFANPIYLWFLASFPILIMLHFISLKHLKRKSIKFANFEAIERVTGGQLLSKNIGLLYLRLTILLLIVLAVSGTVLWYYGQSSDYSYVLAIDSSTSMLTDDILPSRLDAAKNAALSFIDSLAAKTEIGIISFSGTSFVEQEPTTDLANVKIAINNIEAQRVGGTDFSEAIITSANLMVDSGKAKVIILLTDGQSNVGAPIMEAINYAKENRVLIHTIGVGTREGGKILGLDLISKLDELTLKSIASNTGGEYYRATDQESLTATYKDIAASTRERVSIELSPMFMMFALILLFTEWILVNTKYRTIP